MTRARRHSARPEQAAQRCIFQHFRIRGAADAFPFHCPNGGFRRPIEAAIFKSLGVVSGIPDVLVIRAGRTYALELKSEHGKLSPAQRQTLDLMEKAGAITGVAFGLDQALEWLERNGLLRGRSSA